MALIQKSDFNIVVQFSQNIEDRMLDLHIADAENFDLVPRLPAAFYTEISSQASPADELETFRVNYVVPLLVCFAYKRFLLWQGRSVTQYGIRQINEDTSVEISDKARGELIDDIKSKINVYLTRFYNALKDADYTFDGIQYDFDICSRKQILKIRAVGTPKKPKNSEDECTD